MEFNDYKNQEFGWRASGETGEVIIFLHGMPGSRAAWNPQLSELSRSYRCFAWDMPGYGDSPLNHHPIDFHRLVGTLINFIDVVAPTEKVHLVGLSLGGMLALHAAVGHPALFRSLVILDSSPCFGFGGEADPDGFIDSVVTMIKGKNVHEIGTVLLPELMRPDVDTAVMAQAKEAISLATVEGLEFSARMIASHDVRDKLEQIVAPVLVLTGEQDVDTPVAFGQNIAISVKNGTFTAVPQSGHLSNLENSVFVNQQIVRFLKS